MEKENKNDLIRCLAALYRTAGTNIPSELQKEYAKCLEEEKKSKAAPKNTQKKSTKSKHQKRKQKK